MIYRTQITVAGGVGGDGSVSFRRERYIPRGGPDGGDGGGGGKVILRADSGVGSLDGLRYMTRVAGERGGSASGGKRNGKQGKTNVVPVPLGTVVWAVDREGERRLLGEVLEEGEVLLVARGGLGGRGNARFATSTNKVPYIAEVGGKGEERTILLEVRPFADVGIVSLPNAGKSQLLRTLTSAAPEVAEYPYTTREPVRGIVSRNWVDYQVLELPALCHGAHDGKGLGNDFLCCLQRARVVLLLLDGASESPLADLRLLKDEIACYDAGLLEKPVIVALNKVDLPEVRERLPELRRGAMHGGVRWQFISAESGEGIEGLVVSLMDALHSAPQGEKRMRMSPSPVEVKYADRYPEVTKDGDVFVVSFSRAERLVVLPDLRRFQARLQLRNELTKMGVIEALEKAGVRSGDAVRIGKVELQWE